MKKTKLFALVVVMCFALSCEKDEVTRSQTSPFEDAKIGQMHNQGMVYLLNQMKQANVAKQKMTRSELLAFTKKAGWDFVRQQFPEMTSAQKDFFEEMSTSFDPYKYMLPELKEKKSGRSKDLVGDLNTIYDGIMTQTQNEFMSRIVNALVTYDDNMTALNAEIDDIESDFYGATMNQALREPIIIALDVARYSATFWNEHASEYETEINYIANGGYYYIDGLGTRTKKISWGLVAACDVIGGAGAGLSVSPAIIVPFIGWAAWGAAVAGGALVGSGTAAIMQYFMCKTPCA